jgi:hypothetical protein
MQSASAGALASSPSPLSALSKNILPQGARPLAQKLTADGK